MSEVLTIKTWEEIDDNLKMTIHGFVREVQALLPTCDTFYIIPNSICHIIGSFYFEMDKFELVSNHIELSDDHLAMSTREDISGWSSAYGKIGIDSLSDIRCYWKIKIMKGLCTSFIGLSAARDINEAYVYRGDSGHHDPFYTLFNTEVRSHNDSKYYAAEYTEGDIVTIYLDLVKKQIHFGVNEKEYGIAFENIETGIDVKYYLGITTCYVGQKLAIVDFDYY